MPPAILMRYLCPHSSLNKVPLVRIADLSWCNLLTLRVWYPSFPSWCVYCPLRKVSTAVRPRCLSCPYSISEVSLTCIPVLSRYSLADAVLPRCHSRICSLTEVPLVYMQSYRGATHYVHAVLPRYLWCACSLTEVPLADHMGLVAQLAQLLRKGCEVDR